MSPIKTEWWLLGKYALALLVIYMAVQFLGVLLPRFIKRNTIRKRFMINYKRLKFVFIITAALLLLLTFVRVNYVVHGGFLIFLTVILFPFIRSILYGSVIQLNGMLFLGSRLQTGTHKGEIKKFTPLGIWLQNPQGSRFVNYLDLHKDGFTTLIGQDGNSKTQVIIESSLQNDHIIDLLFETPFINHTTLPEVESLENSAHRRLYFTLQDQVTEEMLFSFLNQHDINIVSKF